VNLPPLPRGWVWTTLSQISKELRAGGTPLSTVKEYYENGTIPFVKIEDMVNSGKYLLDAKIKITYEGLKHSSAWLVPCDSLLYSMYASYGEATINKVEVATNQAIIAYVPPKNLMTLDYVYYYLKSIKHTLKTRGTTQKNLNAQIVEKIPVPLAPLGEQVRIVARLEELFARLDAGVEGLRKVKVQLKRYRQAVLKYAFEGKLTEKWRKTHKDQIEPATKLLERIKQERKQKLGPKYKELPPIDTSQLPQLPQGWTWTRPGEFAQINPGFPCGKHNKDKKGIPHIRPMNIDVNGKIDLSDVKYVHCLTYDALLKGDVLFNNTNSPELLGKTAYIEENTNWAYSNHMTRLRFNTYLLDSAYISYYLHNLFLSGFFKINCVHHVNQASINSGFLSERVVIALPSLDEQHRIAEEIKLRQSVAEDTGKAIEESLMRAERLRQSILKMAFEGRLIPQDPGDEAADKLLERIKTERAKSKGEKDINKKKNKPKQLELSAYVE